MRTKCEQVILSFLPLLRALVARELVENYNLKQMEAAKLLGVTQAAISQYLRGMRGKGKVNESLAELAKRIAAKLARGEINVEEDICSYCRSRRDAKS